MKNDIVKINDKDLENITGGTDTSKPDIPEKHSYDGLFNEQMTLYELRTTLFKAVEGKNEEEIEQIKAESEKFIPKIVDRELKLAEQGFMF